ncbi:MAG: 2TM domain-containing protein [Eudoraea sp.]|nr:2TM domain-containing protein [Eudoraea sp.]
MENNEKKKLKRARKKVEEMKGFYIHFAVYILINMFILVSIFLATSREGESFWKLGHFATAFFWGIGLLFHATHVFNLNPFFGKRWEEKQIQKYIDKDKKEAEKYR